MDEKQRERLAELRLKEAERGQAEKEAGDARELEAFELAETLESKGARRGYDFQLVSNPLCGVFAIRKPGGKEIRQWEMAKEKDKTNLEWLIGFLRPLIVEPDETKKERGIRWAQMCGERPGLCWQTGEKFVELMGAVREDHDRK